VPTALGRLALLLLALLGAAPLPAQGPDPNARFGTPSDAKADPQQRDDYLIQRPQYTLSYNAKTRAPNWVSWRLLKADVGKAERGPFEPDPLLPPGFAKVTSHVYDGSGFDRGHMCPAKDRSASQKDCDATFYLTNVVPQSPNCNQRAWERLESYCRGLALKGHELQIISGPQGVGGEGRHGRAEEIGKGRVTVAVPAKVWKVVVVLPEEGAEPRRNTRVIAVVMPNDMEVDYDWTKYRTTAKAIEKLTGLTFFHGLAPDLAEALRGHQDEVEVKVPAPRPGKGGPQPE
jgi:endonuclease G, mitochondrial